MKSDQEIAKLKKDLRIFLKEKRKKISEARRQIAKEDLCSFLLPKLSIYQKVLSFANMQEEIDLSAVNRALAKEKRLLLPHMKGHEIIPYEVKNLETDLQKTKLGIYVPNPAICLPVPNKEIGCILVPGLGFDKNRHRLGYGKGHFDRFLKEMSDCSSFGIGFKEQQLEDPIFIASHDIALTAVYLF